jgi:hypothetical protein
LNRTARRALQNKDLLQSKLLDAFSKLSDFNSSVRLGGISHITAYFSCLNKVENRENYNYILTRLVRGLASNRKCSRIGFSCALTELLITNDEQKLSFQSLVEIGDKNLKHNTSMETNQSDNKSELLTKEEQRHMQIGMVFVYLCWIQSNRINNCADDILVNVCQTLNSLRKSTEIKVYIQQLYLEALILLIKRVESEKVFTKTLLPILEVDLQSGLNFSTSNTKDELHLLLACFNQYPQAIKSKFQKMSFNTLLLTSSNFDKYFELISQSSELLPKLAPFCCELTSAFISQSESFHNFWLTVIEQRLCRRKEPEKKYLSFKLFLYGISCVSEDNYEKVFVKTLLTSDSLIQTLVNNYTNRGTNLNGLCRDLILKELVDIVRTKELEIANHSIGVCLLIKFIKYAKNCHDISDLMTQMIHVLNKHGIVQLFNYLINDYAKETADEGQDLKLLMAADDVDNKVINGGQESSTFADHIQVKQLWVVSQISALCKNNSILEDETLTAQILTYLVENSFFKDEKNVKIQSHLYETLFKYVALLLSKNDSKINDNVYSMIETINSNLKSSKKDTKKLNFKLESKKEGLTDLAKRIQTLVKDIRVSMSGLKQPNDEDKYVFQTFFMIASFESVKMFVSLKESKHNIDDVEICYQNFKNDLNKVTKKTTDNNVDSNDEIAWIDMLVEMLLNLFTINNSWIRSAVKNQFKKLFPKLTVNSVKLIIDLFDDADNNLVEIDDEENEIDENKMDIDQDESGIEDPSPSSSESKRRKLNNASESESTDTESDTDTDTDTDSESEAERNKKDDKLDEELKKAMLSVLGDAAVNEENESDSDLDDDAMMKLDDSLSAAFKMRMKNKNSNDNLMQYKMRALDLVQELFKTNHRLDLISSSIKPLLNILFESEKKPNLKHISQRILGFLVNLKNTTKKLHDNPRVPTDDDVFELLSHVINCSTSHFNVTNTLVEISMFCVSFFV